MNKQTKLNFAKMSKEQLDELTTTVKEIAAKEFASAKSFNIVDLWNIQRRSKTITNRKQLV